MIPTEVLTFAKEPVFVAVAVADASLRPIILRAAGIRLEGARARLLVADSLGAGPAALAERLDGRTVAIVISAPTRAASFQLKGRVVAARPGTEDDLAEGRRTLESLGRLVEDVQGVPASLYRDFPLAAGAMVEVEVHECFDQTPGARAGERVGR